MSRRRSRTVPIAEQDSVHLALKKLVNITDADKKNLMAHCSYVFGEYLVSAVEKVTKPLKTRKRRKTPEQLPSPDKPLIKNGKLPYVMLFYPHALFITKPIKKGTKFSISIRLDLTPTTEIVPIGESEFFHIYSKRRNFEFEATNACSRDAWVRKIQNCHSATPTAHLSPVRGDGSPITEKLAGLQVVEHSDDSYQVLGFSFNEPLCPENIVYDDQKTNILYCKIEKLIERITEPRTLSKENQQELKYFLQSFKLFIEPQTLLQLLLVRITRKQYCDDNSRNISIRQRIIHVVWCWVSLFPEDFDYPMRKDLNLIYEQALVLNGIQFTKEEFMGKLQPLKQLNSPRMFHKSAPCIYSPPLNHQTCVVDSEPEDSSECELTQEEKIISSFLNLQAKNVAEQLCLIAKEQFLAIANRDFLYLQSPAPCQEIQEVFDDHHHIARVVCYTLDNIEDTNLRIFMLSHLIDIAHHCVLLLNLHHAYAFNCGISHRHERHTIDLTKLSNHSTVKWEIVSRATFRNPNFFLISMCNPKRPCVPSLVLECPEITENFKTTKNELMHDNFIHIKEVNDFCERVSRFASVGCIAPYPFEAQEDTQNYLMQIFADNSQRTTKPEAKPQFSEEQIEQSLVVLKRLRVSLFEEFIRGNGHATEFQREMTQLTIFDLQQLIHMDQCNLRLQNTSPIICEIIDGDEKPTENMILMLPNCGQFQIYSRQIRLYNQSDHEISFKILNSQKESLLVRFTPWNGKIAPGESCWVSCKIVMTGNTSSALPIRILVPDELGICLVVVADPKPLSKLREYVGDKKLIRKLGAGGSGVVQLVELCVPKGCGEEFETVCAVEKTIFGLEGDETIVEDFKRELMCLTALEHDCIVRGYGFRRSPPSIYMEYVEGGDLVNVIENKGISSSQGFDIIRDIASAMYYLHELGYIHRDLKPANILVREVKPGKLRAKLCDFGGTTFAFAANEIRSAHGTSRFEAPEVIAQYLEKKSNFQFCQASDVYSFAMIMYCIIAQNVTPLDKYSSHEVNDAVLAGERPNLPNIPTLWKDFFALCWHHTPTNRPKFSDILEQLENLPRVWF